MEVNTSSTGIEGLGLPTLVLAVVAGAIVLPMDGEEQGPVTTGIVGVISGVVGRWKRIDIDGAVSPGIGRCLSVFGGLGLVVAGIEEYQSESEEGGREASR